MSTTNNLDSKKTFMDPLKWSRYILNSSYIFVTLIILAHVIWYFAARSVLAVPPDVYLRNYVILPAIGLFALVGAVDLLIRLPNLPLLLKEGLPLILIIIVSFYLCLTHDIARVLLGSFILAIFVSTVYANIKLTRWVFWFSNFAVVLLAVVLYTGGELDSDMAMQIFVAIFMYICSYLLAKILIRYTHDNLTALSNSDTKQQYMREQLKLDPFTGLNNRKTFDDVLHKAMKDCHHGNLPLALAMIDIDNFKSINDLYGHAAGDRVLLYFSKVLKEIQTENIRAFRMGGDEFAILFKDCHGEKISHICDTLRTQMKSCPLRAVDENRVTFSCGVNCIHPVNLDAEKFIKIADSALYSAKKNGRNQVFMMHSPSQYPMKG